MHVNNAAAADKTDDFAEEWLEDFVRDDRVAVRRDRQVEVRQLHSWAALLLRDWHVQLGWSEHAVAGYCV